LSSAKVPAKFVTLFEGFQQFDGDLNKLQVCYQNLKLILRDVRTAIDPCRFLDPQLFVEINETAVSKILKKVRFSAAAKNVWLASWKGSTGVG
jgi:CDK inhibitor PHO81